MYKDIYPKIVDLLKDCAPLYSNLILLILIIFGSILRLKNDTFENYKQVLFITIGIFIIHFSIVFILCKKKYKKSAYFIAYLPFLLILIQLIIIIYEINYLADKIIDDTIKKNKEKNK